jgi:uncharacterized RDD family membrane protein YckC
MLTIERQPDQSAIAPSFRLNTGRELRGRIMQGQDRMSDGPMSAGWYYAQGDPPDTVRYWDGAQWLGEPEPSGEWTAPAALDPNTLIAGPSARIGGRIIDGLIWLGFFVAALFPVVNNLFQGGENLEVSASGELSLLPDDFALQLLISNLIGTALIVMYETLMNGLFSGTFGKKLAGTEVVDTNGETIGVGRALLRMVPLIVLQLAALAANLLAGLRIEVFWLVALIGLIMLFVDRRRQTPWDKVAGTIVIT